MQWQDFLFTLLSPLLMCKCMGNRKRSLSISSKTDEELVELLSSAPLLESAKFRIPGKSTPCVPAVRIIAEDTLAKRALFTTIDQEYLSMELVRNMTPIPVPRAERKIKMPGAMGRMHLVQQYIPGAVLEDIWPSLSWWKRFRVALTLRYYIYELRRLRSATTPLPFPGPPSVDGAPCVCTGRLFTSDGAGPFASYRGMERWYNNRLLVLQRFLKKGLGVAPFDSTSPLTFTHMDLHPRNIILGRDGQLWIIDWADAGWYPAWFEGASMMWWALTQPDVSTWQWMLPFIAGSCNEPGQLPFLNAIGFSLDRMPCDIINLIDGPAPEIAVKI